MISDKYQVKSGKFILCDYSVEDKVNSENIVSNTKDNNTNGNGIKTTSSYEKSGNTNKKVIN